MQKERFQLNKKSVAAPKHLSREAKTWFQNVLDDYEMQQHDIKILTLACEAWDRTKQARQAIEKYGLTMEDRFGQEKPRPEVAVERDSRIAFARLVRELRLSDEPDENRIPRI